MRPLPVRISPLASAGEPPGVGVGAERGALQLVELDLDRHERELGVPAVVRAVLEERDRADGDHPSTSASHGTAFAADQG